MGGGSGGYDRPPGDSGSDNEDEEREPGVVPEPDSDEGAREEADDGDDESGDTPDSPPVGGVAGGGGGAPAGVPVGDPSGNGGESGTEEETNPSQEGDHQEEEESEEPREGPEDHTDEDQIDSDEGDDSEDESTDEEDEQREEECLIAESAILHSPNPDPLDDAAEGDIYTVQLRDQAVCVVDTEGRVIGSIAEPWVGTLKECMEEGHQYRAHILEIDGGNCEVFVANKCLLDREIILTDSTLTEESQFDPDTPLAVEKTSGKVVVVTPGETELGEAPPPWAEILSDCIDQGREYWAQVIDIGSDQCRVNIQNGPVDE